MTSREASTGYYYNIPMIGKQFSRMFYDYDNEPRIQFGSGIEVIGTVIQNFFAFLHPYSTNELVAVIILLVMNHYSKSGVIKQRGGGLEVIESFLSSIDKNALVLIGGLLLMDFFFRKKNKKMTGGQNDFSKKLVIILKNNKNKLYLPKNKVTLNVKPLQSNLNKVLNNKKMDGGSIFCVLKQIIMPLGIESFLVASGLGYILTSTKKGGGKCDCEGAIKRGGFIAYSPGSNEFNPLIDYIDNNVGKGNCSLPEWNIKCI